MQRGAFGSFGSENYYSFLYSMFSNKAYSVGSHSQPSRFAPNDGIFMFATFFLGV